MVSGAPLALIMRHGKINGNELLAIKGTALLCN